MSKSNWSLQGKNAIVTGGTKGIGLATVREFISLGANVLVVARSISEEFKHSLGSDNVLFFSADLTKAEEIHYLLDFANDNFNSLDILVNNAGTNIRKATTEYTDDEIDYLFKLNYRSSLELSRMFLPMLKKSAAASIINVSSISASRTVRSGAIYASAKAALSQLTRYLAVEWAGEGVRVNAIEPWYILTPLTESVLNDEIKYSKILDRTPMNRIGKPEEAASLIAFLAMDNCRFLTGQTITLDGGASCLLL